MLVPTLIAALIVLASVAYVAVRRLSIVEQEITFEVPQQGVTGITVVIHDDVVRRLSIAYTNGQVCEVHPSAAPRQGPVSSADRRRRETGVHFTAC
jgi:hypothetical protein